MLFDLIKANRELLLARSASMSAQSGKHSDQQTAALGRVSVFLDQLTDTLQNEHGTPRESAKTGAKMKSPAPAVQMSESASSHGRELRDSKVSIEAAVHNYGSICQAVTGYAIEVDATIEVAEFRTLNWCLDEAIAQAVVAFTTPAPPDVHSLKAERLKHDTRLDTMALLTHHIERVAKAVEAMRTGRVGLDGATGTVLDSSLDAMRELVAQGIDQRI